MDEHIPLRDAEVAAGIARGARTGGPADRRPTVAQLLAAFGLEDSAASRTRIERALSVAEVEVGSGWHEAAVGDRVELRVAGGRRSKLRPLLLGLAAIAVLLAGAVLAAAPVDDDQDGDRSAAEALPPTPGTTVAAVTTQTTPTTTARTTTRTTARTTPARRPTRRAARRQVIVRLASVEPTYLCARDGRGRVLFSGTLDGTRRLRAREVRLNVGLASTRVFKDGRRIRLSGSPSGLLLTRRITRVLGTGERPEC